MHQLWMVRNVCVNNKGVLITRMVLIESDRPTYILYSLTNMQHAGQHTD